MTTTQATATHATDCRHCGKPASRHYYGGWCTPAPDRIPSMSGGGIYPAREVRTKYEAPTPIVIGSVIPCDVLEGEEVTGLAAGLDEGYRLVGVGLRAMREVCAPAELTDACGPHDTCFAARVIALPSRAAEMALGRGAVST